MANRFGFSLCLRALISAPSLTMHVGHSLEALADPTRLLEARQLSSVSAEEFVEPRRGHRMSERKLDLRIPSAGSGSECIS